ncbi:MAG TPA: vitamin K epoxide reductase family protein [Streptosporangiaceae bacterium]|jgi:uncharacterized membrane protein
MAGAKQARSGNRSGRPAQTATANGPKPVARPTQGKSGQTRRARDRAKARELAVERERAAAVPSAFGPPAWVQYGSLVLSIFGLGVSIYLTIAHYTSSSILACSDKGLVNCGLVTTSPESKVFGVLPVAVLGLAFYIFMTAVNTPFAWRSPRREIALARLGSATVGVGFILYLIYVELFQVDAICLWCTSVHVATFLLFILIALTAAAWGLIPAKDTIETI